MNWNGNLDSSIGKSARLVVWRSEVRIPIQVQSFLLKSELNILFRFLGSVVTSLRTVQEVRVRILAFVKFISCMNYFIVWTEFSCSLSSFVLC